MLLEKNRAIACYTIALDFRNGKCFRRVTEEGDLSWIHPDGKSKKKSGTKIAVRVVEYTINADDEQQTYRLINSLRDIAPFPALLLATEHHQRWEIENTVDELKTHLGAVKISWLRSRTQTLQKQNSVLKDL